MRIISANISGSLTLNGVDVTNVTVSSSIWSGSMAGRIANLEQFSSSLDATFATDAQLAAATASLSASLALPIAALNSYTASNTDNISALNAQTASLLAYTSSNDTKVTALNTFSSSILSYTSSNNANISSLNSYTSSATARFVGLETATASLNTYTSSNTANITSLNSYTSSATDRFVGLEAATSSLNSFTSSANTRLGTLEAATASLNSYTSSATDRFVGLEAATASLNSYTSSNTANITSLNSYTSSATARFVGLEAATSSLNTFTSSINSRVTVVESKYATTGSNTFTGQQYSSNTTVPVGFANTTASIYTDGGLLAKRDVYFSSSLYIKGDLIVYGTQSVEYITSSNLNISDNIITVNTATPSVRFGGLAVYDSGSTGLTGSLLWDSQNNNWLYSNPTGSGNYDSSMVIMGPRNSSALGNEAGLTCNYLVQGHGSHHTTSSMIYHDGLNTCIPNTLVGCVGCFSSTITATGTIRSNDVNSYQLFQASNTTDTKLWSIQNLPTSGDFRIRAGNDAFTNGINGITISRTGISSVSVALGGNTTIENSGTFTVGSTAGTGTGTLYASTACFASRVCTNGLTTTDQLTATTINGGTSAIFLNSGVQNSNGIEIRGGSAGTAVNWKLEKDNTLSNAFQITPSTAAGGTTFSTPAFTLTSAVACFSGTVCASAFVASGGVTAGGDIVTPTRVAVDTINGYTGGSTPITIQTGGLQSIVFGTNTVERMRITSTGIACFTCQVCAPTMIVSNCINIGTTTSLGSRLSIQSANDQAGITMYNSYDCNQWSLRTGTTGINNKGFSIVDDICNLTRIQIDGAGRVGIGTLIPQSKFHISIADRCAPRGGGFTKFFLTSNDADTNYYEFQSTATTQSDLLFSTGNTGNYGIIGYNHNTDSMRVYTKSNIRLTINGDGIACFACQVCAPFFSVGDGTQSNEGDAPLTIKRGIAFAGLDFKSLRTTGNIGGARFYDCAGVVQAQQLVEVDGSFNFYNATSNNRFKITSTGIACFACQICAPIIQANYHSGQCMTLSSWSSNSGLILNYGNASGQVAAINLQANGITNGYIGMQMVNSSNGDLWLGGSSGKSMTLYRTGNTGFRTDAPCTGVHVEGGYGATWGGNACFFGGGVSGGGFPYGDIYGNGASYTYQTACTTATSGVLLGGYAAGYFKGGPGTFYGGGGAGVLAIGGDGANSEGVNSGGGAGLFARGGKNGAGSAHSYAGWFDGGNVIVRCGNVGIGTASPAALLHVQAANNVTGKIIVKGGKEAVLSVGEINSQLDFGSNDTSVGNDDNIGGRIASVTEYENGAWVGMAFYTYQQGRSPELKEALRIANTGISCFAGTVCAPCFATISDYRMKSNVRPIEGLSIIMNTKPYKFEYNYDCSTSFGMIAHELQDTLPEAVFGQKDGEVMQGVDYMKLLPITIKAIQEQQCTICTQASMINILKTCLGIA